MSQENRILMALKAGEKITPIDALEKFGCFRLSGRIKGLRNQGYDIITTMIETPTGKHVAQYWMVVPKPVHTEFDFTKSWVA